MKCSTENLFSIEQVKNCKFFTGVPDSLLSSFIKSLDDLQDIRHIPAVNEAHAVSIAFGAMLAKKEACVYLQNSGLGNIINPLTSLCIPSKIFPFLIIGHRHSLQQHKIMGEIDGKLMELLDYPKDRFVIDSGSNNE